MTPLSCAAAPGPAVTCPAPSTLLLTGDSSRLPRLGARDTLYVTRQQGGGGMFTASSAPASPSRGCCCH